MWLQAQIHLLGNPVIWYSATLAVLLYVVLLTFYLLRRHRCCYDLSQGGNNITCVVFCFRQ